MRRTFARSVDDLAASVLVSRPPEHSEATAARALRTLSSGNASASVGAFSFAWRLDTVVQRAIVPFMNSDQHAACIKAAKVSGEKRHQRALAVAAKRTRHERYARLCDCDSGSLYLHRADCRVWSKEA